MTPVPLPLDEDTALTDAKVPTFSSSIPLDSKIVSKDPSAAPPVSSSIAHNSDSPSGSKSTPKVTVALASPNPTPRSVLQVDNDGTIPPTLPTVHRIVDPRESSVVDGAASGFEFPPNADDISSGDLVSNIQETSKDTPPGFGTTPATPVVIEFENVVSADGIPGPSNTVTVSFAAQNNDTIPDEGATGPIELPKLPAVVTPILPELNPFQKAMLGGGILGRMNVNPSSRFYTLDTAAPSSDAPVAFQTSTPAGASSSNPIAPSSAMTASPFIVSPTVPAAASSSTPFPAWTAGTNPFSGVTRAAPIFNLGMFLSLTISSASICDADTYCTLLQKSHRLSTRPALCNWIDRWTWPFE